MDVRQIYAFEIRPVESDKVLIRIDGLNEAELDKIFKNFRMPTRPEGYDKLKLWNRGTEEDEIIRRSPLANSDSKQLTHAPKRPKPEPSGTKPESINYTAPVKRTKEKGGGLPLGERS